MFGVSLYPVEVLGLALPRSIAQLHQPFLKYWTSRSCLAAAARVEKVPRLRRRPVFAFFFLEYSRYCPDFSLRIMPVEMRDGLFWFFIR